MSNLNSQQGVWPNVCDQTKNDSKVMEIVQLDVTGGSVNTGVEMRLAIPGRGSSEWCWISPCCDLEIPLLPHKKWCCIIQGVHKESKVSRSFRWFDWAYGQAPVRNGNLERGSSPGKADSTGGMGEHSKDQGGSNTKKQWTLECPAAHGTRCLY